MASGVYDVFKEDLMDGSVNVGAGGDTLRIALYDNTHSLVSTDSIYTTTNELPTAGGYTLGGQVLANQTITLAASIATFDADDSSWTAATFTTYHCVIYDATNTNSLMCSIDFGGAQSVTAGTFTIRWNVNGIITLT